MTTVKTKSCEIEQDDCGDHTIGRDKAYPYLEGKLSDPEADEFVAHMQYCASCTETVAGWYYERAVLEVEALFPAPFVSEKKPWDWAAGSNARAKKTYSEIDRNALH